MFSNPLVYVTLDQTNKTLQPHTKTMSSSLDQRRAAFTRLYPLHEVAEDDDKEAVKKFDFFRRKERKPVFL